MLYFKVTKKLASAVSRNSIAHIVLDLIFGLFERGALNGEDLYYIIKVLILASSPAETYETRTPNRPGYAPTNPTKFYPPTVTPGKILTDNIYINYILMFTFNCSSYFVYLIYL